MLLVVLLQPINISQAQIFSTDIYIDIKTQEYTPNTPEKKFSYWVTYLENIALSQIDRSNDFYTMLFNLEFLFTSGLAENFINANREYFFSTITKIMNYIQINEVNGLKFANISDPLDPRSPINVRISDILFTLNSSREFISDNTVLNILDNSIQGILNTLFVKNADGNTTYGFFQFGSDTEPMTSFDLYSILQWINETNYSDELQILIADKLNALIPTSTSSWLFNAYTALLYFKAGTLFDNNSWIQFGNDLVVNDLLVKRGYTHDGDTLGYKSNIIKEFFPYNNNIVKDYANFIISLMFNYSWGLQPLVTNLDGYNRAVSGGTNVFAFFNLPPWISILSNLAKIYPNEDYYEVLEYNTYYLLQTLYFDKKTSEYITFENRQDYLFNDSVIYSSSGTFDSTINFLLILAYMFNSLLENGVINDNYSPNVSISYWNYQYNAFSSSNESFKLEFNIVNKIATNKIKDLILLRIKTFDSESGLGNFVTTKNNQLFDEYPNSFLQNVTYYDNCQDSMRLQKIPNNKTIVVPIDKNFEKGTSYEFNIFDKVGNYVSIFIKIDLSSNQNLDLLSLTNDTNALILVFSVIFISAIILILYTTKKLLKESQSNAKNNNKKNHKVKKISNKEIRSADDIDVILEKIKVIQKDLENNL